MMFAAMESNWISDIDPKDASVEEANVKLAFEEAKTQLRSTADTHSMLAAKANGLLGFIVALSTGLIAYILGKTEPIGVYVGLVAYLICAVVSLVMTLQILWSHEIDVDGYWPQKLFHKKFMIQKPKELTIRLIHSYGNRIQHNTDINKPMRKKLEAAAIWYLAGSALFSLMYLARLCHKNLS